MQPTNSRQSKTEKAFTLIELLVVIAIVGILAGLAVVSMSGATEAANIAKGKVFAASARNSLLSSMISEWRIDGTAQDSLGGNDGTISGDPQYKSGADCVLDQCLEFDGTADCFSAGNPQNLQLTGDMTISMWVYPTNVAGGRENPIDKAYGGEFALTQETSGSLSYFQGPNGGEVSGYMSRSWSNVFKNNTWINLVLTRNTAAHSIKLYVNGYNKGEGGSSWQDASTSTQPVTIGCGYAGSGFHGRIDDVRIFGGKLSLSGIRSNYLLGLKDLFDKRIINFGEYTQKINESEFAWTREDFDFAAE